MKFKFSPKIFFLTVFYGVTIEFLVAHVAYAAFTSRAYNNNNSFTTGNWTTPSATPTVTLTPTLIPTSSPSPTQTLTPTSSPTPTLTLTPTVTLTPTETPPLPTSTATSTPSPTSEVTTTPTETPPVPTATTTPTETPTSTPEPTVTPTSEITQTPTETPPVPTSTEAPTLTLTPTVTPTSEITLTPTITPTSEITLTPTQTPPVPTSTETPTPTITPTTGAGNTALQFSGLQSVEIPDSTSLDSLTTAATWEFWMKPNFANDTPYEVLSKSNYGVDGTWSFEASQYNGQTYIKIFIYSSPTTSSDFFAAVTYPMNEWTHVVWVYDGSGSDPDKMKLYVNGSNVSFASNLPSVLLNNNQPLMIGKFPGLNRYFNGVIDEVRIWNVARSASEIAANYQKQLTGSEVGLVAYYRFNEGSGTSLSDATRNSNNSSSIAGSPSWVSGAPVSSVSPAVVINEIMWMGSTNYDSSDEWIELKNLTPNSLDLTSWFIEYLGEGSASVTIPTGVINPNNFFLISKDKDNSIISVDPDYLTSSVSLHNNGEQLTLKNYAGTTFDTANQAGAWYAGVNVTGSPKQSMARQKPNPGDGTVASSWHTSTTQANLDGDTSDLATPKGEND